MCHTLAVGFADSLTGQLLIYLLSSLCPYEWHNTATFYVCLASLHKFSRTFYTAKIWQIRMFQTVNCAPVNYTIETIGQKVQLNYRFL